MKKVTKIITVIVLLLVITGTMVLTSLADAWQYKDDLKLQLGSSPTSDYFNADWTLIVETDTSIYTVDLSQSSVDLSLQEVQKILIYQEMSPELGIPDDVYFTKTQATSVAASRLGDTGDPVLFTYYTQYRFIKEHNDGLPENRKTPRLERKVYFTIGGSQSTLNGIMAKASNITMVAKDCYIDREKDIELSQGITGQKAFVVNYKTEVEDYTVEDIDGVPTRERLNPMSQYYGIMNSNSNGARYDIIHYAERQTKEGVVYRGLEAHTNQQGNVENLIYKTGTKTLSYAYYKLAEYYIQDENGNWEPQQDTPQGYKRDPIAYYEYAEYPIYLNKDNFNTNQIDNITLSAVLPIEITYDGTSTITATSYILKDGGRASLRARFLSIVDGKPIVYETVDVGDSLVTWITNAVQGFFDFEIAPKISIGSILTIVAVLAIFIFIIKVFMGG